MYIFKTKIYSKSTKIDATNFLDLVNFAKYW